MTTGVLVMAYGTPTTPSDIETFYTDVRRGRPPSPEQLADLTRRYQAIGGISPLNERTAAQVAAIRGALEALEPGGYVVTYGAKHAAPKLEDGVAELAAAGVSDLVGVVLAPHYSRLSIGEYKERVLAAASSAGLALGFVEHWHDDPTLITVLAERVTEAAAELGVGLDADSLEICFTAHSLPARILDQGDPYPAELEMTARLVAAQLGPVHVRVGWQSAGRTPEPWIGPDILELLRTLAAGGTKSVIVCPAGFTSDHLEVLYDLDIEAKQLAEGLGISFTRTRSLNDEPRIAAALARRISAARVA